MKKNSVLKRIITSLLVLVMMIGMCPQVAFAAEAGESADIDNSENLPFYEVHGVDADVRLPESQVKQEKEEAPYADTDMVRVSIVLNKAATLELFPTADVASNGSAMAYRDQLQKDQETVAARIEAQVLGGEPLDVVWNLTLAANIISANVLYGQIDEIAAVRGVKEVFMENQYAPLQGNSQQADPMMSTSTQMTGASAAWAAGYTGAGSRIAIIDTGLDLDHQSFDSDAFLYALAQNAAAKNMSEEDYLASLDLLTAEDVAAVLEDLNIYPFVQHLSGTASGAYYFNEKVPFGINYVDRDYDVTHDNDAQGGHGSHVAGIAAANSYIPSGDGFASAMAEVSMQGVAPDAQLIIMKVFGKNGGAYDADYMVAIEDAILLGCDVVNLSLGTDKGFARNSNYQDILDSLAENDVIVAVAAGNSGYWSEYGYSGTGHLYVEDVDYSMIATPAASTQTLAVASAENAGLTNYYIQVGDQVIFYEKSQFSDYTQLPSLTEVAGDVNYIYIDGIGTAEEVAAVVEAEGGTIAPNTILVCSRGTINFAEKANNAVNAGFIATIVYNNAEGALIMNMDGYEFPDVPAVSVTMIDGQKLKAAAQSVTGENGAEYFKGTMYISDKVTSVADDAAYQMSSFSSWGVPGSLELKPEIVAPGGNIYSVNGEDPSGKAYYNNSGTSMASPQIAGMAALAMQYIKETGLDTKLGISSRVLATSLLMSTAEPMLNGENFYPIMQQGAGLANLASVVLSQSYIMMASDATDSASDGKVKAELGDDPDRTGAYTFSFDLNNFGEEAQVYSINGNFFTQNTYTVDGITYADTATTALSMAVNYAVEGGYIEASELFSCDLNHDGVTDAEDAQIILEYVSGNLTSIDQMADVSGNGTVSSYDAHLLLASIGEGYFLVQPGDTVTITVSMTLSEDAKTHLDSIYTNGAYVEGFVNVKPLVTEEGQTLPTHSIPVLGFYGNWSDASMYDRANYEDYLYATENGTDFVFPYTGSLNYLTFFDEEDNESTFVGNPYVVEEEFPAHKAAINPNVEIGDMASSLIRNGAFMFFVMDEEGNVVESVSDDQVPASYFYQNAQYWVNVNQAGLSVWYTPEELGGFQEGDRFTIGFFAVPEYYETDGPLSNEDLLALMDSGKIGEGAYHTYSFTVDGTAPELLSVEKLADGDLVVKAKDNQYVAAVAVLTASGGQVLTVSAVDQENANTVTETVIDMEDVRVNRKCLVMVADYAGNEVFYELSYNDGLADFEGRMYGFTNAKTLGSDNSWLEIDPDTLYYDGGDSSLGIDPSMGGTMDVANMDFAVTAAEYVGGHIYMITENNELRVAIQGEWADSALAAIDPAYSQIKDMAFNTSDNKLYALGNDNTIYTIDLYNGALEKQYTISISAPEGEDEFGLTKSFSDENKKLLTLAIDDEGNFYSVNNGDSTWQRVYLYTWSNEDVQDGAVSDLTPVNNTYEGFAGEYVYNDDIPATGSPTIQSMAWDHDNDILYWASAVGAVSAYNYLYSFDLETGKASIVTENPISGVADYCLGCLCVNVSGLYIVPKESIDLEVDTIASKLILGRDSLHLLVGSEYRMPYDVLPWNLEDKGLNWITSNADVVTVDEAGTITAVGVGEATITATTRALPHLAASCTVTVEDIQDVELNGMLYNTDGNIEWMNFNLLDAENWTGNFVMEDYQFLAGGLHGDVLYVHDGSHMYGVDANNFEVTDYGYLHESWLWSDAATGPETPDGYFDRLVGIINGGMCIGVMNVEEGMGYEVANHMTFAEDPAALIAYIGSTTYFDGMEMRHGHEYYIMTEGGELFHDTIYAFYDADLGVVYSDNLTHVGSTGLNLSGMSNPTGPSKGSMYYDIVNDYLIVTAYRSSQESAAVYVFQPDACAPVEVGSFGVDNWPVVSLYSYSALNDLFVTVKPDKAECYVDETVQLTAKVYLAVADHGVTWSSSDETVATVNKNGLVTALKPGTVTITATANETNDAGEQVTASATITFKPLDSLDLQFHAYVQTEEGGKWVAIDGNTMNYAELAASDAVYTGALVSDGIIYATDSTHYYAIDPSGNAYTVTQGDNFTDGDGADFLYMLDGTAAPKQTVNLFDYETEQYVDVEVGGTPAYISGFDGSGYYLTLLSDYTTGEFLAAQLEADRCPAGIAHYSSRELEGFWFDHYYILGYDGFLQTFSVYGIAVDGKLALYDAGWEVDYVPTGLVFDDGDDVSITYVETDTFSGIVIAHATGDGVEFFSYDVQTRKLGKLGVLEDATDLVGLSLASDLNITVPEMPDPEQPVEPEEVDYLYGYMKTASGYEWVRINPNTQEYETLKQDNTGYTAGGVLNGMIYAVTGVTKYGNTTFTYQQVDPTNDYAMNATGGDTAYANYTPMDFSGVPFTEVTMTDSLTGAVVTKNMGGYMVHISNGKYTSSKPMTFMFTSYTSGDTELYTAEKTFDAKLAGIVYVGSELSADGKSYYDNFLILDQEGNLYNYCLTSCVKNGKVTLNSAGIAVTKIGSVELKAAAGASMTRMTGNLVYISVNGTSGVELYSYDLAAGTLKALGAVEGAQTLAVLHTDAELTGIFEDDTPVDPEEPEDPDVPVDPEQPEEPTGTWLHAYVKTENGYAWAKIDSATGAYVVLSDYSDTAYTGAGSAEGVIYATALDAATQQYLVQQIDPANGYAATTGKGNNYNAPMLDLTAGPVQTVSLEDGFDLSIVDVTVGTPMYITTYDGANYLVIMPDYSRKTSNIEKSLNISGTQVAAIAYLSSKTSSIGINHAENFAVLCSNGALYTLTVKYSVDMGETYYYVSLSSGISTGLSDIASASMDLIAENQLCIGVNTASGTSLYSFDLSTNVLSEAVSVEGVESLVGLTLLSDVCDESEPEQPECDHSNVDAWEYDEAGHWKTCECGEKVEQGEHEFVEGLCECGYADPNYQPEQPEEPAAGTWLHAYVKTESGYAWVKLNAETCAYEVLSDYSDVEYTGAGVSDGMIYATDIYATNLFQIDPNNGYAASAGAKPKYGMAIADVAAAPKQTVELYDSSVGSFVQVEVGGAKYVAGDEMFGENYVIFLNDYATSSANKYEMLDVWDSMVKSMALVSAEVDEAQEFYYENYVILAENGKLYDFQVAYNLFDGQLYWNCTLTLKTTLDLTVSSGATMTRKSENLLVISVNTDSGAVLYTYDLATGTLAELVAIADFETLVGLSLLSEVRPDLAPDTPAEPECDHSNVGAWEYDDAGHWQTCECGEKVNEGEHSFVNGYCVCGKPCAHTDVSEWQYNEERHWKTCSCGEYVQMADHVFVEGLCECGYADPNYQPPMEPEEPSETETWLHAYVKTETGYAWVMINFATGEYDVLAEDDAAYTGAGMGNDGLIYAYVDGKYVQIDPANDYAVIEGAADSYNVPIHDATGSAPEQVVSLIDEKTLSAVDVTVGGYLHYVSMDNWNTPYLVKLFDYSVPTAERKYNYNFGDTGMEAITYLSCELLADNTYFFEHYLVVNTAGDLYKLTEKTKVYGGTRGWRRSVEELADLNLDVSGGASMMMLDENVAVIAASGESGVILYSFDLTTNSLTTLYTLEGVTDLVDLELLENVRPELVPEEPEQPEESAGTWIHAYVKTESGYAWVKIDSATGAYEVLAEGDAAYTGAGVGNDGLIYAYADGKYVQIDPDNGYAVTEGAADSYNVPIHDATGSAPEQVVSLIDEKTLSAVDVTVGGYLHYVSLDNWNTPYLVKLFDYSVPTAERKYNYNFGDTGMEAITYLSCELLADNTYFYEYYLVVNSNGDLYKLTEKTKVYGGTRGWRRSVEELATLSLDVSGGASMMMLDENTALIAANGASGVTLYSFDLTTNSITTLSALEGVTDLVGLELLSKVQPEQSAQAKKATGSLMSVYTTGISSREVASPDAVVISDGTVKFDLVETENVTNGKLIVTFNADVLTFQECTSASVLFSVNASQAAEGRLVIAYAAGSAIAAGDILASLTFTYEGETIDTEAVISTEQRNAEDAVSEDETVVEISNYDPSDDNTLKELTVQEGTLTPEFDPEITEYEVEVPYGTENLTVEAIVNDENATVEISDTALNEDGTAVVTVTVTAENGDVKVYTINVTRKACTHEHTEVRGAEEATCTEDGYTGDTWCLDCETMIEEGETISASGHSYKNGKCEHCGKTDPNHNGTGKNPGTGDGIHIVFFVFVFSALSLMVLLRKKRNFAS